MNIQRLQLERGGATAKMFAFKTPNAANEYLAMFTVNEGGADFKSQLSSLLSLDRYVRESNFEGALADLSAARPAFKRYYLSDAENQVPALRQLTGDEGCAVSMVQQPPLNGTKVGMWVYYMTGTDNARLEEHLFRVSHDGYDELWSTQNTAAGHDSFVQTEGLMSGYAALLRRHGCTLADNCVRTWLYVNDIDNQYAGVVRARNAVFDAEGLTDQTHYIASTGIGGRDADHSVYCKMNAIAIRGLRREQVSYLYALDHLNRTSDYGVRFERGTCVDFAERRRVYISGTASIGNKGQILHQGDIVGQTHRMWENIEALLDEAGCTFGNVAEFSVYLRDIADYAVVSRMFRDKFPNTPYILLHAPVCRPGWLIESECIALRGLQ